MAGLALGVAAGGVLAVVAAVGGRRAWAATLLPAGVLSFPAGLWAVDAMAGVIQSGLTGAGLLAVLVGPAVNGMILGALLGALAGAVSDGIARWR